MDHVNVDINDEIERTNTLYKVTDVAKGYSYWYHLLFEKCLNIFEYDGLPENLPAVEIERRIMRYGYAVVFEQNRSPKGESYGLVTSDGGLSDQDIYFRPTTFTFAQPVLGSGVRRVGRDCEIIWNSAQDMRVRRGLNHLVQRYARLMADVEATLATSLIMTRVPALTVVKNQAVALSVDNMFSEIENGNFKAVHDMGLLDNFDTKEFAKNAHQNIEVLNATRDKILTAFYSEIGVMSNTSKSERMIVDEVQSGIQPLVINISEMLKQREDGIAKINKLFGSSITVKLNPMYDALQFQNKKQKGDGEHL